MKVPMPDPSDLARLDRAAAELMPCSGHKKHQLPPLPDDLEHGRPMEYVCKVCGEAELASPCTAFRPSTSPADSDRLWEWAVGEYGITVEHLERTKSGEVLWFVAARLSGDTAEIERPQTYTIARLLAVLEIAGVELEKAEGW